MAEIVNMPRLGLNENTSLIGEWMVNEGDKVRKGDGLFSIETDKSSMTVYAETDGVILKRYYDEYDVIEVMTPVCVIGQPGEEVDEGIVSKQLASKDMPGDRKDEIEKKSHIMIEESLETGKRLDKEPQAISPRARRLAQANGIDYVNIIPSGAKGRIIEKDILNAMKSGKPLRKNSANEAGERDTVLAPAYDDVPLSSIRKLIAKTMHESLNTTAQLTHSFSFDATQVLTYRKTVKENRELLGLADITLNDIIMYAVARVLKNHKEMNAHFMGDSIRVLQDINLGMAVDTPKGLLVPTIFDADRLSLNDLALKSKELARQAQEGTILPELLKGASFTVSNLGVFGVEHFTPIINPPQVGILGVNNIQTKWKMKDGKALPYQAMGISLTYDHRALDGVPASKFAQELCRTLENFLTLLAK